MTAHDRGDSQVDTPATRDERAEARQRARDRAGDEAPPRKSGAPKGSRGSTER